LVLAAGNEPLIAYRDRKEKPPHLLPSTTDARAVAASCELLLVATSAKEVRQAVGLAQPGPNNRVVVTGRGLEPGTGLWLSQVVETCSPVLRVGALAGPAPVDEILNGGLCAGVVASPFDEVRQLIQQALHSSRYRVYQTDDLRGVELSSAIVPVLAMLIGVAKTLSGSGVGMHAMVLARGLAEASRVAQAVGGRGETVAGLAGMANLVATHGAPGSRYFDLGVRLARGEKVAPESFAGARALRDIALACHAELPLTQALVAIGDGLSPLDAVQGLMARDAMPERW